VLSSPCVGGDRSNGHREGTRDWSRLEDASFTAWGDTSRVDKLNRAVPGCAASYLNDWVVHARTKRRLNGDENERNQTLLCACVVGAVILKAASVTPLRAQGNSSSSITQKLDQIIAILTTTPPDSGSVLLSTPIVTVVEPNRVACVVVNVGTTPIARIEVRWVDRFGEVLIPQAFTDVPPGETPFVGFLSFNTPMRCEFSFEGSAAAVRANILIKDHDLGQIILSADAR